MPIFRSGNLLIYFAHIPKCGGTSIESTLTNSGYKLSFFDHKHWQRDDALWQRSSPQHILASDLQRLFHTDIFDYKFTIFRDPVARFLSAFNHNRHRIGRTVPLRRFIKRLEENRKNKNDYFGAYFDNHFVPASRFIPDETEIFLLDDGMGEIIKKLSERLQKKLESPSAQNRLDYDSIRSGTGRRGVIKRYVFPPSPKMEDLEESLKSRILRLYDEDQSILRSLRE